MILSFHSFYSCHKGVDVACFSEDPTTAGSHLPPLPDDQTGSKYIKLFAPIVVFVVYHCASLCKFIDLTNGDVQLEEQ